MTEKPIIKTFDTGALSLGISLDTPSFLRAPTITGNRVVGSHKGVGGDSRRSQIVRSKNSYPSGK